MTHQSMILTNHLYAEDYNLWIEKTASLLKNKQFLELELENLIEEIESMGRSENLLFCAIALPHSPNSDSYRVLRYRTSSTPQTAISVTHWGVLLLFLLRW